MKTLKTITMCFIVLAAVMLATQATAQIVEQPHVDAQATAVREVVPDRLFLSITIKESDYKGKKTLQEMQDAMIGVLKVNRIDVPEALSLDFMGSNVSYKVFSRRVVPKSQACYILELSDASIMQKVIYDLEEKGISNIELERTKYTQEDELKNELAVEAMKKAQLQAQTLAGAIGQSIGKAVSINSWSSSSNPQPRMYKSRAYTTEEVADNAAMGAAPEIPVSKLTYQVNVNVRFELK